MTHPCTGIGRFLGHRFRGRYNETSGLPAWLATDHHAKARNATDLRDVTRTYIHDVCERCGAVVNRERYTEEDFRRDVVDGIRDVAGTGNREAADA